ncbi:hypothetical protein [Streptomyces sp. SID10815]|uniref:hypothetical protein n=1 Tax=Streptomyces sp. SID10815 TaxID=2706027 RepID=UPI0013C7C35A|nr:hypothetical protein [Streptomyces sp. SID10815]NEA52408.1 hypothetical protein [Streptomyces sp. SID10815]
MTARPLLLIDVDGPLNPYAAPPHRRPDGYQTHRTRPSGWDQPWQKPLRVWLNPAHGPALLALPFDLVWCTTWACEANEWIGPHIGLPELPVIEWPEDARQQRPGGVFWKTEHVVKWAAGRPFAWIDDDFTDADREFVSASHDGPALLHFVSPRLGLLPADFDTLAVWAATNKEM